MAQPGLTVAEIEGGARWMTALRRTGADLVVASHELLPAPPKETVAAVRSLPEQPELVLLADWEDGAARARLLSAGAWAVLPANLPEPQLRKTIGTLVERRRELQWLRLQSDERRERRQALDPGTVRSGTMKRLLATARRVAESDSSLLILGETGAGKEWLARAIHAASRRAAGPFVAVNCAALSETLLESELFGHERGAFTGAERARRGHFEMAHRGTLFLDEIGDMPPSLQAKLLRAVEEKRVQRLGSERPVPVDVRLMAATHRDLRQATADRTFRADLYYRLAVVELDLPPLRERRADLAPLAEELFLHHRKRLGRADLEGLSPSAIDALGRHEWPGNVRELANAIERAVLLSEGPLVRRADLPVAPAGWSRAGTFSEELLAGQLPAARRALVERFEREYFVRLLRETGGRVGKAARRAGIDVRTVRAKLGELGLDRRDFRPD